MFGRSTNFPLVFSFFVAGLTYVFWSYNILALGLAQLVLKSAAVIPVAPVQRLWDKVYAIDGTAAVLASPLIVGWLVFFFCLVATLPIWIIVKGIVGPTKA